VPSVTPAKDALFKLIKKPPRWQFWKRPLTEDQAAEILPQLPDAIQDACKERMSQKGDMMGEDWCILCQRCDARGWRLNPKYLRRP
jgi:hypothetical protein